MKSVVFLLGIDVCISSLQDLFNKPGTSKYLRALTNQLFGSPDILFKTEYFSYEHMCVRSLSFQVMNGEKKNIKCFLILLDGNVKVYYIFWLYIY